MLKLAKKRLFKKSITVLLCLLIVGNLIHWRVLCLGADGHVEVESAFHECCNAAEHSAAPEVDYNVFSSTKGHEMCEHCGPCVDIPITNELIRLSKTTQESNLKSPIPPTFLYVDNDNYNYSKYHLVIKTFSDTSFYTPLSTVILQI